MVLSGRKRAWLAGALLAVSPTVATGVAVGPAFAEMTECVDAVAGATLEVVQVPAGESCTLDGVHVMGDIFAHRGSFLALTGGTAVDGSVLGDRATVQAAGAWVGGTLWLYRPSADSWLCGTTIGGALVVQSARSDVAVGGPECGNWIGGDVILQGNRGDAGLTLEGNTIGGSVTCEGNDPAPVGGGNTAAAVAEDCGVLA